MLTLFYPLENFKQIAGEKGAEFVREGMTIGLGSGSTVYWTIRRLGARVKDGLTVRGVATSKKTEDLANKFGLPLIDINDVAELDLTIDGADEISPGLDLIKGGGGALLREKLVAAASKRLIIVADEGKLVPALGRFPLPLEIVPFGWKTTQTRIEGRGFRAALRMSGNEVFITDSGNFILDCHCGKIDDPARLHRDLKSVTGVIETGLFIGMAEIAVVAGKNGVRILS